MLRYAICYFRLNLERDRYFSIYQAVEMLNDFVSYLEKINFDYDTKSEKLLKDLKKRAAEDGYLQAADITALEQKIIQAKKSDLETHKKEIIDQIEKEAVGRFWYQRGQIKTSLRKDEEIDRAIKLLNDDKAYKELLANG